MNSRIIALLTLAVALILVEIPLHRHSHFADHAIDGKIGFYAGVGVTGVLVFILIAKVLGLILKVKETYYND